MIAVRIVSEGRVQGVGYRAFVARRAVTRGLQGWVRNRADGSVEAVFCGEAEDVAAMIAECRRGPTAAKVRALTESPAVLEAWTGFEVRPSA
jgi:acylphosphatase